MFILSSTSSGSEFWSVNHISICEISESKDLKRYIKCLDKMSNNYLNNLLETSVYKSLESCW